MRRRFPPLRSLQAFEAAARHGSFKNAADELAVTPAAISQQIKQLEDYYGVALFKRTARATSVTEAGAAILPGLSQGFDMLADALARLDQPLEARTLSVSTPPSFGVRWFTPRLSRFSETHPEIALQIDATDRLISFQPGEADVAIRFGSGDYPGLVSHRLVDHRLFPVCSPSLLQRIGPLDRISDLARHTLLLVRESRDEEPDSSWRLWLKAAGAARPDLRRCPQFGSHAMAIEAALAGQGVALADWTLVEAELRDGRLVRPFKEERERATAFSYFLVYPRACANRPDIAAFRDWLLAEMASFDRASAGAGEP